MMVELQFGGKRVREKRQFREEEAVLCFGVAYPIKTKGH